MLQPNYEKRIRWINNVPFPKDVAHLILSYSPPHFDLILSSTEEDRTDECHDTFDFCGHCAECSCDAFAFCTQEMFIVRVSKTSNDTLKVPYESLDIIKPYFPKAFWVTDSKVYVRAGKSWDQDVIFCVNHDLSSDSKTEILFCHSLGTGFCVFQNHLFVGEDEQIFIMNLLSKEVVCIFNSETKTWPWMYDGYDVVQTVERLIASDDCMYVGGYSRLYRLELFYQKCF